MKSFGKSDFICPFCYDTYDKKLIKYVCPQDGCRSEAPAGKEPVRCVSPSCPGFATDRVCPGPRSGCTKKIPKIALETPNLRFSIVGISTSGKTNYITVMLEELMNFAGLRLALGAQTRETTEIFKNNRKDIYELGRPLEATNVGDAPPQIWYISNLAKQGTTILGRNFTPKYTFSIYDGAGENYDRMEANEIRYIRSSEAFIITLDPLILEGVRAFVDPETISISYKADSEYVNSMEIVETLVNHIKEIKGIRSDKPLDIPVAVVLTKFDTISSHATFTNSLVKKPSSCISGGKGRVEEFDQVHDEIEHWLQSIGEQKFINAMDSSFTTVDWIGRRKRHYKFFAVSSYGSVPTEANITPERIRPHRVLDPMLWLFKLKDFVD